MNDFASLLQSAFPDLKFESEVILAPFTTIKIGGPAEVLASLETTADLVAVLKFSHEHHIPVTMLGWGANTLIADRGIRGLLIRNLTKELTVENEAAILDQAPAVIEKRHQTVTPEQDFSSLDYQEATEAQRVIVTLASGWPLPSLIATLLSQGITSLQWYSRIPATLGGAIVNNIHGGSHFLSEVIESVRVFHPDTGEATLSNQACDFGYDYSRFHTSGEILLDARLCLWRGDVERARAVVAEWAKRKSNQPQRSLGCVFQNITPAQQQQLKLPTPSIGYIIDQVLGLKGKRIGGAVISTKHAAFIENVDGATARDYLDLALTIQRETQSKLGINLRPEIFFRGFEEHEISELTGNNSL